MDELKQKLKSQQQRPKSVTPGPASPDEFRLPKKSESREKSRPRPREIDTRRRDAGKRSRSGGREPQPSEAGSKGRHRDEIRKTLRRSASGRSSRKINEGF